MGRRAAHASGSGLTKCANNQHLQDCVCQDRISLLPYEILISILSLLTIKEAVQTSVLSKRWTHMWNYVTLLDFDDCAALEKLSAQVSSPDHKRLLRRGRAKFVKRVRKVLQSHKSLALDEFRVDFDLDKSSQKAIDKWVQYAFQRKVQRLELNLVGISFYSYNFYTLWCGSLGLSSLGSSGKNLLVDFSPLKELILNKVNVSGEVLEFFLHNCKFLEYVAVYQSRVLTSLEVSGPSLALQHLEICCCNNFKSLSVCDAANLVSLKISWTENIVLKNVPLLVGVSVCDICGICNNTMKQFSYLLPKVEVLTLTILPDQVERLYELPQLTELKQLTLIVDVDLLDDDYSMLGLTSLIKASPYLEKFVLKLVWYSRNVKRHIKFGKVVNYPHQHLKVVELRGYCGCTSELELVKYFVKNAISLEKIIIDPHCVSLFGARWDSRFLGNRAIKQIVEDEEARRHARQHLGRLLPSHVGLTIV